MKAIIAFVKHLTDGFSSRKQRTYKQMMGKTHDSNWVSNIKRVSLYISIMCAIGLIAGLIFPFVLGYADTPEWTPVTMTLPEGIDISSSRENMITPPSDETTDNIRGDWTTIFSDSFEGAFPGDWVVSGNNQFFWGKRNCRPYSDTYSAWVVGGGTQGSALACGANYPHNASSWMVYGPFSLENATDAEYRFRYWLKSELNWDWFYVSASIDGSSFSGMRTSGTSDWTEFIFDLTNVYSLGDLTGQPEVWIALRFTSDGSASSGEGVFVDDFLLRKQASDEPGTYAFINQPWDWVEGKADPNADITAILKRGGLQIANTSITSNHQGYFSLHFVDNDNHIDLIVGDEVVLSGGGLSETLKLIDISGSINYTNNRIQGQATGGIFPAEGVASIGQPSDLGYITKPFNFANNGSFTIDFDGLVNINMDHLAKVDYEDPAGNRIVQLFSPTGLDIRALITEGRVEGVTNPGEEVSIRVFNANSEIKASATTMADQTGFYSTLVYRNGYEVDLELGDHIEVKNSVRMRSTTLRMYHASLIEPWNDRVLGNILGINISEAFPDGYATGRVDLWSVTEQKWFTKYMGIGPSGEYLVNFSDVTEIGEADIIRVWITLPDGNQQAALGWGLHIGASLSDDEVWGYTIAESEVEIELYRGLVDGSPESLLATQTTTSDKTGFFSTRIQDGENDIDLAPSNVIIVKVGQHEQQMALFIGDVRAEINIDEDKITIIGPSNALLHLEGRSRGVSREDAQYQDRYYWSEFSLDETGTTTLNLSTFGIRAGDWFDITCYYVEQGWAVHTIVEAPIDPGLIIYLPLILR